MLSIILAIENEEERTTAENIWNTYNKKMYLLAFSILRDDDDANDAVMNAITRIIRNIRKFMYLPKRDIESLIFIYTKHTAIDLYNHKKKRPHLTLDDEILKIPDNSANAEDEIIEQEALDDLIEHIKRLPEIYSSPLLLRFHHDYTIAQISDALDTGKSTIRSRISRARKMLAEILQEDHYTL